MSTSRLLSTLLLASLSLQAQAPYFPIVSIGDSLGEGVQSGDANFHTQPYSYVNLVNFFLGAPFSQPLIRSNFLGSVGDVNGRSRVFPAEQVANLAVSGATVNSLLHDTADGIADAEIDLVLQPYQMSQIGAVEWINSSLVFCWIGANDALRAATAFDQLNATQMTPVASFEADYNELVQRLVVAGRPFIAANLPDIANIAFLVDRDDLIRILGTDYGLPAGHKTSAIELLLLKAGFDNGSNLRNPDYVLDPTEQAAIQQRIEEFNQVIEAAAASVGMPVVDVNSAFSELATNPPVIDGVTLTTRFLGGLFSLDGVHPSNIGNALVANLFLEKINDVWGTNFPLLSPQVLNQIVQQDPFVDRDGDGSVTGRPYTSLLETLAPLAGISGDSENLVAARSAAPSVSADSLLSESRKALGKDAKLGGKASDKKKDVAEALARGFGVKRK